MKGFLIFLLAIVLILVGGFGLFATVFGTMATSLMASIQGLDVSLTPAIFIGIAFFVILVLGIYLKK